MLQNSDKNHEKMDVKHHECYAWEGSRKIKGGQLPLANFYLLAFALLFALFRSECLVYV